MLVALVFAGTASADPASDKDRIDQELAEAEATLEGATDAAREAGVALAAVEAKLPGAQDRVNTTRGLVAAARILADVAASDADVARADYDKAVDDYAAAVAQVQGARDELGDLVTLSYQGAGLMLINGVINASDPFEAAERMYYVERLADRQRTAIDQVVRHRQDARNAENTADVARQSAQDAEIAAGEALEAAQVEADEAELAETELNELLETQTNALQIAEAEKEESLTRYEDIKAESERITKALQDAADNSGGGNNSNAGSGDGTLLMPVAGWKSSDFGDRYDPYYQVWQLHAGVDFAADGGTPIYAAEAGEVVYSGWNGGYGNYTCIYHGGRLSTCYAHQTSISVSYGQWVERGQRIGTVGTTGASTGNHLHFEVRLDGNPVQPLEWLPGCLC
ncbi:murein DD-endopeptidase MepM/ murein hydrolase activator NlpD [Stackebrandtia endophytica]|uniref:Murein DD-endopeptidase MepM/ murein hydrolase activator NlpD n=1 Tax=Stackebrandtia endophytica TaxID=1496996 RepID=A0A543AT26_9ACTN|nr:murein DD-endopeptidase MepM/ murein hydrolase activator NlpD [Stackebrandtia endophytica]